MLYTKRNIKKSSLWGCPTRRITQVRPLFAAEENKDGDFPSMFQGPAATDKTSETSDKPFVSRYKNLNYGEEVEVKWRDPVRKHAVILKTHTLPVPITNICMLYLAYALFQLMESNTRIQFGDFITPVLIIYPLVLLANDQFHFMPQSFSIMDTLMGN
jgi:hypothetical protein